MLGRHLTIDRYLDACGEALRRLDREAVLRLADDVHAACASGRYIFLYGGTPLIRRPAPGGGERLPVLDLFEPDGGDEAAEDADGLIDEAKALSLPGDVLIAVDAAGQDRAVRRLLEWAGGYGVVAWLLTGAAARSWQELRTLRVPLRDAAAGEAAHRLVLGWLLDDAEARLWRLGRYAAAETLPAA